MKKIIILSTLLICFKLNAQPVLTSWMRNTTGVTGYGGIIANIDSVMYSDSSVYVRAAGIPSYSIGPWHSDPNIPIDERYLYRFPRYPQIETSANLPTPLGAIGMLVNGVPVYNAEDGRSYNNQNIWHSNAGVVEALSFDSTGGHADAHGAYHYHINPKELYPDDSTKHSPIIGYSFDGFPIYGPFAYKNADGTGGIVRMTSSYMLKIDTTRANGPDVSSQYPLGYYIEDYEYVAGLGTLDQYNGRFAVTPDYPNGTYAYYVTVNAGGEAAYPYIIGPDYYGAPEREDFHTTQVSISEPIIKYTGQAAGVNENLNGVPSAFTLFQNYPNPFNPTTAIGYQLSAFSHVTLKLYDVLGREVATLVDKEQNAGRYSVELSADKYQLASGIYYYRITADASAGSTGSPTYFTEVKKLMLLK